MPHYRILFRHPTYEDVNIRAASDTEACAAAERIHAAFRDPPSHYEVWEGARHVHCGGRVRVPSWLKRKLRELHRPTCFADWPKPATQNRQVVPYLPR